VLDATRVLNRDGLRFPDEFVRHKVLDLLGDLALLGARVEGHVIVERGGHALHQKLVAKLAAERTPHGAQVYRLPEISRPPLRALLGGRA
jgi:UDP-3-O-[3-hydroxymyristoyl] N-acetylglucosamine deacetylase